MSQDFTLRQDIDNNMGPLMLDLLDCELSQVEQELLQHPTCGGVILFTRNYHDVAQIIHLCQQIRRYARNDVIIAVDHEGGRVQRFREGFSPIPAMGQILKVTQGDVNLACQYAKSLGFVMALEVQTAGMDISFAPVLDVAGICAVVGDRGFSDNVAEITAVAGSFIDGMNIAGMQATGKHFPGHGGVAEDTHFDLAVDNRNKEEIFNKDLAIFKTLIEQDKLAGIMPAHVLYPAVDDKHPAGFSDIWIKDVLHKQLNYSGVVFSDDLSMHGASVVGDAIARTTQALAAGCDMALCCNDRASVEQILDNLPVESLQTLGSRERKVAPLRLKAQFGAKSDCHWHELKNNTQWQAAQQILAKFY